MELPGRRPLSSRDRAWTKAFAATLARARVSPNSISNFSVVFAGASAAAFVTWPLVEGWTRIALLLVAAAGIQLRLLCNLFDGMVAVEGGLKSPTGDLYNEVPDRLADTVILLGVGYGLELTGPGWPGNLELAWAAALLAMFTAYLRALGRGLGLANCFHGPMAKQHRMALLTLACLAAIALDFWGHARCALWVALMLIVLGCAVTSVRRLWAIAQHLRGAHT